MIWNNEWKNKWRIAFKYWHHRINRVGNFFKTQIACVPAHYTFNLLKPTGHVMHQQFNIQQLYPLPTLYLCVLCLSENKQRLVSLTP